MSSVSKVLLGVFLVVSAVAPLTAQQPPAAPVAPCSQAEQKQLEFWVGEWDLSWPGNKAGETAHGTNSVHRIMDGCIVQENFNGGDSMPLRGMSVSTFNAQTGKWQQTWVDNQGSYIDLVGEFKDGQMILTCEMAKPDGTKVSYRMVYKNVSANEFDWSWESSKDGGKTWTVQWPIHYKRKAA